MNQRTELATMSEESDIVRQIEALLDKIVAGVATDEDRRRYVALLKRRGDLMQPSFSGGERRRARVA
jgi:hypothetical protein